MTVSAKELETATELGRLKSRLKATWMTGDYDRFSRYMEKDAELFFNRQNIRPGTKVLDVGCGAGQFALIAARAGAHVTGCDISTNWIEKAQARAAAEGLKIKFEEGDAEALPYKDGEFDVVASLIGAMFAPRPELVAKELTRVCRPGGIIAMANWTPRGFVGKLFKVISKHIAPSGMPAPALWGDEDTVRDRLSDGIANLKLRHHFYHFDYPFPPDEVVEFYRINYGPMTRAFDSLDENGQQKLRSELIQLWSEHNQATDQTTKVDAEYLEVIATRGPAISHETSRRAAALADRIEEGATGLAAFVEGLSDEEWKSHVSAQDRRSIGVIVHHVATVYPLEIELAKAIASGKPVTDISWEVVAKLNAEHAQGSAAVTKEEALQLLRRNGHEAAEAVRLFTDAELDQAAPLGLSYGAPVTAQFVIEDHALRHSWHHLARIRKALGK